ncbi:hypothetical protein, partial [Teichococcus cervicalis]|uniref:hypothetical protein n=1 Tax=Teichococcus cervicalis TaxID=204525 RepID=UPI00058FF1A6
PAWLDALPRAEREAALARAAGRPLVAIAYQPDSACFFRGDDPLLLLRQVPELLLLHLVEPESWPPGELFDPFDCRLGFRLLSLAPEAALRELFRYCDAAELQIAAWQPEPEPEPEPEPAPEAGAAAGDADAPLRLLLDAQARLLAEPVEPALLAGRAASVAEVLRRV